MIFILLREDNPAIIMGESKKKEHLLYLVLLIFAQHFEACSGSFRSKNEKDTTIDFHRNYTGVYFDPLNFMRYNGLNHILDESGLIALIQKIHSTFDQIMVPIHIPPTLGQDSTNHLLPETVARENVRLNKSTSNKSRGFTKLIILCKVHDWKDITIIQEHVQRLRNVVSSANSRFPGTVKSVLLEMGNGTNEAYQNYALFRQFFLKQSSVVKQDPDCTFGLQVNIETSATLLIKAWKWEENLRDIPGTTYFSEYFSGDIDGASATTYLDTLKSHFGTYLKAIRNLNNGTEIAFMATWPDTGVGGRMKYSELVGLWKEMNDWAAESKNLVIFLQAFDTPFNPEGRMMTNGWWRLLPNSSYRHPSEFIFEDKASLTDIDDEKESVLSNMAWLRQDAQFSRDSTAVVFNPDILKYPIDKPNPYSNASLKALVQQVSTQFSKILVSMTRLTVDDTQGILLVPQIVAGMNLNGSDAMEVIMTFDESSVNSVTNVAQAANSLAKNKPGVVKQLIYIPSTFQKDELISATQKIANAAGEFKSFDLGIQINLSVCSDRGDFMNFMKLARSSLNSVPSKGKFIHISANIPHQHTKLGADRILPIYTAMLGNCKSEIEGYFQHVNESINVTFLTKWPPYDEDGLTGLTEFLKFCRQINEFSLSSNSTVIFSSAFDEPNGATMGWWKLLENETFPETVNDFLFEDKKQAALRYAEGGQSRDHNSTTPLNILSISAVAFPILLIAVILSTICYHQRTNKSKYLTNEEIGEFFNGGGDHTVNGVKEPYKKTHFELPRKSFTIDESSLLGSGVFGKVCLGTISKGGKEDKEVAVKMTKVPCPRTALRALLFEIKILTYLGGHEHIVELIGACTAELKKGRAFVFLERCALGSLEGYLRKQRSDAEADNHLDNHSDSITDYMSSAKGTKLNETLSKDMYRWAGEIANGMEFIASKHIVHLDIASRNILLTLNKRAKITDFGLSRRLYDYQTYIKKEHAPLPWRWMAPESLRKSEFTEKSDVWGFGVLLWEIYSLGDEPYPGLSFNFNFASKLENGLRLGQPTYNENEIYSVMLRCWSTNPERRPTFSELTQSFGIVAPPKSAHQDSESNKITAAYEEPGRNRSHVGYIWSSLIILLAVTLLSILIITLTNFKADARLRSMPSLFLNSTKEEMNEYKQGNGNRPTPKNNWTHITALATKTASDVTLSTVTIETSDPARDSKVNRKDKVLGQALFRLIQESNVRSIATHLQFDADVNQWNGEMETPLIRAAYVPDKNLSLNIIRLLVDHGADVYARDKENRTFLHILVSGGSGLTPSQFHDIAEYLISKNQSTSSLFVMEGWTNDQILFHVAVLTLEFENRTLTLLHQSGVDFNVLSKEGNNVLVHAIYGRRSQQLMLNLMNLGADCKHLNKKLQNLLHAAAQTGLLDEMAFLLELGLDVNARDNYGHTPLHHAVFFAKENILKIIQLLIANGAQVSIKDRNEQSALQFAKMWTTVIDKEKVVKLLSDREIAEEEPGILGARLFDLIDRGNEDLVKVLVGYGADLNVRNDKNETPLFRATYPPNGDLSVGLRITKYLIEKNSDVYAMDSKNRTFLHHLVGFGTTLSPSQFHDISSYLISKNMSELFNTPGLFFGATPLHLAVKNIDEVENRTLFLLLENGINFNMPDNYGDSILAYAVLGGRSVKYLANLVDLGANWEQLDKNNRSLIHDLARLGRVDGLDYFFTLGLDSNAIDANGETPLHKSVTFGKNNTLEPIKILIKNGASVLIRNNDGRTPLEEAGLRNDLADKEAVVKLLRESELTGASQEKLSEKLFDAIASENEELVEFLIEFGADVKARNARMETPLIRSTYCSDDELRVCLRIAKYLIGKDADVYARDTKNGTFLHNLVAGGTTLSPSQFHDISSYLISKNMSALFSAVDTSGLTPLHLAVRYINEVENRTLTLLKRNGVNFNSLDRFGQPILTLAVEGRRSDTFLATLVSLGANWRQLDKANASLIHVAAEVGLLDGLKYFLRLGLDINAVDVDGDTPLHTVVMYGEINILKIIRILIESGANILLKNNDGRTPLEEAVLSDNFSDKQKVIDLLKEIEKTSK